LKDIAGKPMLAHVVERTRRAEWVDEVVVATTVETSDDPVAALCTERGYPCVRGSMHDVLDRYYQAAKAYQAEIIVRITADCPVIDPGLIDAVLQLFVEADPPYDFIANRLPEGRTYPIGLDTEVCSMAALETAWIGRVLGYEAAHEFHGPSGAFEARVKALARDGNLVLEAAGRRRVLDIGLVLDATGWQEFKRI